MKRISCYFYAEQICSFGVCHCAQMLYGSLVAAAMPFGSI